MPHTDPEARKAYRRAYYLRNRANVGTARTKILRNVARQERAVASAIDGLLAADELDADVIRKLATRARYPDAAHEA